MIEFSLKRLVIFGWIGIFALNSCVSTKKAVYFNNITDTEQVIITPDFEPVIKPNDILGITVTSLNPEATEIFNKPVEPLAFNANTATTTASVGYLVNLDGYIQFPIIGNVRVTGLTQKQFKTQLAKTLVDKKLLVDPVVDVRILNFRVSVMGEVSKPGVVTVPSEKISILEALALAGDLTVYARRDNVLLIREENGKRITKRIDLTASNILTSPYYYLRSNDIIYAEPNKSKIASTGRITLWLPVIFSLLTFGIIVVDHVDN